MSSNYPQSPLTPTKTKNTFICIYDNGTLIQDINLENSDVIYHAAKNIIQTVRQSAMDIYFTNFVETYSYGT